MMELCDWCENNSSETNKKKSHNNEGKKSVRPNLIRALFPFLR